MNQINNNNNNNDDAVNIKNGRPFSKQEIEYFAKLLVSEAKREIKFSQNAKRMIGVISNLNNPTLNSDWLNDYKIANSQGTGYTITEEEWKRILTVINNDKKMMEDLLNWQKFLELTEKAKNAGSNQRNTQLSLEDAINYIYLFTKYAYVNNSISESRKKELETNLQNSRISFNHIEKNELEAIKAKINTLDLWALELLQNFLNRFTAVNAATLKNNLQDFQNTFNDVNSAVKERQFQINAEKSKLILDSFALEWLHDISNILKNEDGSIASSEEINNKLKGSTLSEGFKTVLSSFTRDQKQNFIDSVDNKLKEKTDFIQNFISKLNSLEGIKAFKGHLNNNKFYLFACDMNLPTSNIDKELNDFTFLLKTHKKEFTKLLNNRETELKAQTSNFNTNTIRVSDIQQQQQSNTKKIPDELFKKQCGRLFEEIYDFEILFAISEKLETKNQTSYTKLLNLLNAATIKKETDTQDAQKEFNKILLTQNVETMNFVKELKKPENEKAKNALLKMIDNKFTEQYNEFVNLINKCNVKDLQTLYDELYLGNLENALNVLHEKEKAEEDSFEENDDEDKSVTEDYNLIKQNNLFTLAMFRGQLMDQVNSNYISLIKNQADSLENATNEEQHHETSLNNIPLSDLIDWRDERSKNPSTQSEINFLNALNLEINERIGMDCNLIRKYFESNTDILDIKNLSPSQLLNLKQYVDIVYAKYTDKYSNLIQQIQSTQNLEQSSSTQENNVLNEQQNEDMLNSLLYAITNQDINVKDIQDVPEEIFTNIARAISMLKALKASKNPGINDEAIEKLENILIFKLLNINKLEYQKYIKDRDVINDLSRDIALKNDNGAANHTNFMLRYPDNFKALSVLNDFYPELFNYVDGSEYIQHKTYQHYSNNTKELIDTKHDYGRFVMFGDKKIRYNSGGETVSNELTSEKEKLMANHVFDLIEFDYAQYNYVLNNKDYINQVENSDVILKAAIDEMSKISQLGEKNKYFKFFKSFEGVISKDELLKALKNPHVKNEKLVNYFLQPSLLNYVLQNLPTFYYKYPDLCKKFIESATNVIEGKIPEIALQQNASIEDVDNVYMEGSQEKTYNIWNNGKTFRVAKTELEAILKRATEEMQHDNFKKAWKSNHDTIKNILDGNNDVVISDHAIPELLWNSGSKIVINNFACFNDLFKEQSAEFKKLLNQSLSNELEAQGRQIVKYGIFHDGSMKYYTNEELETLLDEAIKELQSPNYKKAFKVYNDSTDNKFLNALDKNDNDVIIMNKEGVDELIINSNSRIVTNNLDKFARFENKLTKFKTLLTDAIGKKQSADILNLETNNTRNQSAFSGTPEEEGHFKIVCKTGENVLPDKEKKQATSNPLSK